ncbi:MAG: CDP-alcohol phosphatidyltransferase family protein [Acidobacteria bacterium]|nr:CDP-alcohol phosphatidyltransferase family protein [Acidobacteriota bacterium]
MDERVLASQKHQERLAAFWPRKVSRYFTSVLVKTPVTPNQVTILWGLISALNSYTVYLALTGRRELIVLIPLVYLFCIVLDSVDGEVARYKNMANPIGGKLLDGICHRATEFALLMAYAAAGYVITDSPLAVPVGLLLLTGDAMHTYVYERRLTTLRLQAAYTGHVRFSADRVYNRGARWGELTRRQQVGTISGLFNYKSVYAVIAVSYLPPEFFVGGLALLALYKHWQWIALAQRTMTLVAGLATPAPVSPTRPAGTEADAERVAL